MEQFEATPPRSLSIDQTAALLGLSRSSVTRHIAAGRIPAVKLGRRVLVPEAGLRELLEPAQAPRRVR